MWHGPTHVTAPVPMRKFEKRGPRTQVLHSSNRIQIKLVHPTRQMPHPHKISKPSICCALDQLSSLWIEKKKSAFFVFPWWRSLTLRGLLMKPHSDVHLAVPQDCSPSSATAIGYGLGRPSVCRAHTTTDAPMAYAYPTRWLIAWKHHHQQP